MPRKNKLNKICKSCKKEFETLEGRSVFCSQQCAGKFNRTGKNLSQETKTKISIAVKNRSSDERWREKQSAIVGRSTKGKYKKNPKSILDLSKRTVSKILRRLNIGCSQCGWNEAVCDIHHINGRKIDNPDCHTNLTYVCPNCHRKCHVGLIKKEQLVNLQGYIGDQWKDFYYG